MSSRIESQLKYLVKRYKNKKKLLRKELKKTTTPILVAESIPHQIEVYDEVIKDIYQILNPFF